jgi:hypothetical protein
MGEIVRLSDEREAREPDPPLPGGCYGRWCRALVEMLDIGVPPRELKRLLRDVAR